jgi:hypothetical protein
MKKISMLLSFVMLLSSVFAQKDELVQQIKEDYSFVDGAVIDHMVTLNLSESMWKAVTDANVYPQGKEQFYRLGGSMVECHDYLFDTQMIGKCDAGSYPNEATKSDCEKEIIADKNKIHVTVNGAAIAYSERSHRLMFSYILTISDFLGKGANAYGFSRTWRPKSSQINIILELSETVKEITVKWSADFKTATITAPVNRDAGDWSVIIGKGLERGGAYTQ